MTPTVISVKFVFEKTEDKQKEAGFGQLKKEMIILGYVAFPSLRC